MIRFSAVLHVVGLFLLILGGAMLIPLAVSAAEQDGSLPAVGAGAAIAAAAGGLLFWRMPRPASELTVREGVLVVAAIWVAVPVFGALPFIFSGLFPSVTDAVFESISGFTTTGATVLADVEVLPEALQLWRCFTHWLGGMGVVLLGIAVLPLLGIGGMQLYRAEFSGARSEKLTPRVTETALSLWRIYVALTLAEYAALRLAGMTALEAACHSLSTLGTGGFSSRTASIAGFGSPLIEYIVILFMVLAGINFTRHYRLWSQRRVREFFGDVETQGYLAILLVGTLVVGATLVWESGYGPARALRAALFQVSSIVTTTGFITDDYEKWHPVSHTILVALMFVGGCTGSTAGGIKVARLLLLHKVGARQFQRIVEPRGVFAIRLGGQVIPEQTLQTLLNMVYLALLVFAVGSLAISAMGADILTAAAAVIASMFNIGPGLGLVGPVDNYGHLPALSKWILCACMICGRLEFYTALVILAPPFWRK
ncbi:MAG: potassium transporter [Bryobacteraceae bacterium]|nr:potassium transporter [Bryobacteraceae bacterium]